MAGIIIFPAYFHDLKLRVGRLSGLTKIFLGSGGWVSRFCFECTLVNCYNGVARVSLSEKA
jgi:hypothetical protein